MQAGSRPIPVGRRRDRGADQKSRGAAPPRYARSEPAPREGRVRHLHNFGNGFSPKPPGLDVEAGIRKKSPIDSAAGRLLQLERELCCRYAAGIANGNYRYNYLLPGEVVWDIAHREAH